MEATPADRDAEEFHRLDQQIRTISTMNHLVQEHLPGRSRLKQLTTPKSREARELATLLCRHPSEMVTVAALHDAMSTRPYFEPVVSSNMEQGADFGYTRVYQAA
jgi:hypothetical protein